MKGFSVKIRCVAFQSTVHHQTHWLPIGQELSNDERADILLVSSSNLVSKHWNILCFFEYSCWNWFEFQFLKYCTHKMRAFSKALKSRKRGVGALCWIDKLCPSHSDAHSGLCKTRRMTWIFFVCFLVLILSFFSLLWQLVGILNSLRLTGSTASRKTKLYLLVFYPPFPQILPLLVIIYALLWVVTV